MSSKFLKKTGHSTRIQPSAYCLQSSRAATSNHFVDAIEFKNEMQLANFLITALNVAVSEEFVGN